ncbi:hypothetical protein [Rhodobacter sp. NSM]|uniref:hypothetical protein n=1 Tax=Rhodobacter sp. NSM TaxID=3457501 RepID=UPI003FD2A3B9
MLVLEIEGTNLMAEYLPLYEVTANYYNLSPLGIFDCPCGVRHKHGLPEKKGVPEHRVAHCVDQTLHPKGYNIVWQGKTDGVRPARRRRPQAVTS